MKKSAKLLSSVAIVAVALTLSFCKREPKLVVVSDSQEVPDLPETPYDYPASQNDYLATLGRVLFYDKELSANHNISCGSCHKQSNAFTDNLKFSPGTDDIHTTRNTPSIFAKNGRMFWDGRSNSIQDLVLMPVRNPIEMNIQNIPSLVERIASLDYYAYMIKYAFPKATKVDSNMIKSAMAEFLKNFNFSNTKFARSKEGSEKLNPSEQMGKDLFFGRAKCSQCHHVEDNFGGNNNSSGYGNTNESHNIGLDLDNTKDKGVGAVTKIPRDEGAFMMPVLLNVEYTAPYMHDGRFKTLEEVVEHYNSEIKSNPNLDMILRDFSNQTGVMKLNLTDTEKKGLVDFLKTLTDPAILQDPKYSDPFVTRVK